MVLNYLAMSGKITCLIAAIWISVYGVGLSVQMVIYYAMMISPESTELLRVVLLNPVLLIIAILLTYCAVSYSPHL
jgi:hypothetical protein